VPGKALVGAGMIAKVWPAGGRFAARAQGGSV